MSPKRDFNVKFPDYSLTGCPLTNQGLACRYTGFCLDCPFRLLLNVVNLLNDSFESSIGLGLRQFIFKNYGF